MAFSTESVGKWLAEGRNYASNFVGFVGGIGLMSAAQSKGLTDSLNEIYQGLSMVFHGATSFWQILAVAFPIIGVVFAKWAKKSASVDNQAAAVATALKDPNTDVSLQAKASTLEAVANIDEVKTPVIKVADPVLAELVPSDKVKAVAP